jgi:hypothetical protein
LAENPVGTLARLLAGVVLTQGRLGHQVLGQMLILGSDEVAVAGAMLVMAGTTRQRSIVLKSAIGTAASAVAVRALISKEEARLVRARALLAERQSWLEEHELEAATKMAAVEKENDRLRRELEDATRFLAFLGAAPPRPPPPP